LIKESHIKIFETEEDAAVYIYIENKRCPSRVLRTFFTKVIYCEYKRDASVETAVLLMVDKTNRQKLSWINLNVKRE
jgi:hypothetical protein